VLAETPTLAGVAPADGIASGGEVVTVNGTRFTSGARVLFGDQIGTNVVFRSANQLQVTTPGNLVGTVAVTVINPDGQQAKQDGAFTYVGVPTLTAISP